MSIAVFFDFYDGRQTDTMCENTAYMAGAWWVSLANEVTHLAMFSNYFILCSVLLYSGRTNTM